MGGGSSKVGNKSGPPDPDEVIYRINNPARSRKTNRKDIHKLAKSGDLNGLRSAYKETLADGHYLDVNCKDADGLYPLHYAVKYNHPDVARLLVEYSADCNAYDRDRATPLHYAARKLRGSTHGDKALETEAMHIVDLLVEHNADVNFADTYGSTPLHVAAIRGNDTVAKLLLLHPAIQIGACDKKKVTALHEAATYNHLNVAQVLINWVTGSSRLDYQQKFHFIGQQDEEGLSALHMAAMEGNRPLVESLVNAVTEEEKLKLIDMLENEGCTALHLAIENRAESVVEYLINQGADVHAVCAHRPLESTALHLAAVAGQAAVVELLLNAGAGRDLLTPDADQATPLHRAVEYQNKEVVQSLMNFAKNPASDARSFDFGMTELLNVEDEEGFTPLLTACCYANAEVVRLLLQQQGASVTAFDRAERTAIYLASKYNETEGLLAMLEHIKGSEDAGLINNPDTMGLTPLHVAAENGFSNIVKTLLKYGAYVDAKNEDEETATHLAAQNGHKRYKMKVVLKSVCNILIKKTGGKCLSDEDEESNTALHWAALNGHLAVVQLISGHGADKEARNTVRRTPLDNAAFAGHLNIVQYLLEEDVPVDPLDREQTTPLHLASRNGHVDVVKHLLQHGADITICDKSGDNALNIAINKGHRHVATTIVESDQWKLALMNVTTRLSQAHRMSYRVTPLRQLIRRMPEVAQIVFEKCITTGHESTQPDDNDFFVDFNYEFVDDTFSGFHLKPTSKAVEYQQSLYDADGLPNCEAESIYTSPTDLKDNHVLSLIVKYEQEDLIMHPLILSLISRKWYIAGCFYALFLAYYTVFLSFLTSFVVLTKSGNNTCTGVSSPSNTEVTFKGVAAYIIIVCSVIGMLIELGQLSVTRLRYLATMTNLLDWFSYVSAILVVVDFSGCGQRVPWQYQLGAFSLFFAWMDVILFMRRLPKFGIYVVMVTEIFNTFIKFFVVFLLFIVAFALSFYVLLQNQDAFRNPGYALTKTWVMMLGEMDYTNIFHGDSSIPSEAVDYEEASICLFVMFLVLLAIIVNNLLTGLAVDDVSGMMENAKLKKLGMQIDLALDVELALTRRLQRTWGSVVRNKKCLVNDNPSFFTHYARKAMALMENKLGRDYYIQAAIYGKDNEDDDQLGELEDKINRRMTEQDVQLQKMSGQMNKMETMLQTLVERQARKTSSRDTSQE